MAYNSKVINKVLNDFENKSKNAVSEAETKRNEVYQKFPELFDIDKKLSKTYIELVGAVISSPSSINPINSVNSANSSNFENSMNMTEAKIEEIKDKNRNLQKQRKFILEENGYSEDYTEPVYECAVCKDTGYIKADVSNRLNRDEVMCECLKKALAVESLKYSGLGKMTKAQNFANFNLNYYEKTIPPNVLPKKESPYKIMKTVYETCKQFADNFDNLSRRDSEAAEDPKRNLIFIGQTGLGKTHLSSSIAAEVIKKGFDVFYDTAQNILYSFEKARFSRYGTFDFDILDRYMICDLLIIDDLGTEFSGNMSVSSLYNLMNTRLTENKSMIISTNLTIQDIQAKYEDRIASRIMGEFTVLYFIGDDIRYKKL